MVAATNEVIDALQVIKNDRQERCKIQQKSQNESRLLAGGDWTLEG
jgi:hypothetical protein